MTFRELADRMLDNAEFRHEMRKNPKAALERVGVKPTDEQLEALKKVDYASLEKVARAFKDDIGT